MSSGSRICHQYIHVWRYVGDVGGLRYRQVKTSWLKKPSRGGQYFLYLTLFCSAISFLMSPYTIEHGRHYAIQLSRSAKLSHLDACRHPFALAKLV
jgi:hypothetical protein